MTFLSRKASRSRKILISRFFSMPFNVLFFISLLTSVFVNSLCTSSRSIFSISQRCLGLALGFLGKTPSKLIQPIARQKISRSLSNVLSLASSPYNGLLYSVGFLNISKMSTEGGGIPTIWNE